MQTTKKMTQKAKTQPNCFRDIISKFIENENENDAYYVEGIDSHTKRITAWIDCGNKVNPTKGRITLNRYSWLEINSLIDLVEDGLYTLPLTRSYGPPKFSTKMVSLLRFQRKHPELFNTTPVQYNKKNRYKAKKEEWEKGVIQYKKPPTPKRRVGRPKKYKWSIPVESSNLKHVYYDLTRELLTVEFNTGRTYEYYGVPKSRFLYLAKRASSVGKYFHKKIRFSYPYQEI